MDLSKVDKRGIEPLIKCGAMDSFNLSRKEMLESLEDAMKYAKQNTMTQESGISDLFGNIAGVIITIIIFYFFTKNENFKN